MESARKLKFKNNFNSTKLTRGTYSTIQLQVQFDKAQIEFNNYYSSDGQRSETRIQVPLGFNKPRDTSSLISELL